MSADAKPYTMAELDAPFGVPAELIRIRATVEALESERTAHEKMRLERDTARLACRVIQKLQDERDENARLWEEMKTERDAAIARALAFDALPEWVIVRWNAEVAHRPIENVYRRTLDNTWRQVYRHLTGAEFSDGTAGPPPAIDWHARAEAAEKQHGLALTAFDALKVELDVARTALAASEKDRDGLRKALRQMETEGLDLEDICTSAPMWTGKFFVGARSEFATHLVTELDELRAAFATSERNAAAMREALEWIAGYRGATVGDAVLSAEAHAQSLQTTVERICDRATTALAKARSGT